MANAAFHARQKEWLGHPRGLFILFFTEMWERFSYYGMRALLVLYMTQHLIINAEAGKEVLGYSTLKGFVETTMSFFGAAGPLSVQALSSQLYGFYTAFVYLTPFFGGILADRFWGQRKSVYVGGVLMAIGHFLMASEHLFFVALLFLILGNGCFKPNISTQVGSLYREGDPRRDGAFTLFYMGVNLGAFFSPLVCGTLGQKMGWHYGFTAAGVGMIIGLLVYHFGRHELPVDIDKDLNAKAIATDSTGEWKRVSALVLLCLVNVVFWAVYEQQGNTLQIWADENTNWNVLGWNVPSTWYQSFNPFFIFLFAPVLGRFWQWQSRRGGEPNSVTKMGIGSLLLAAAFVVMIFSAQALPSGGKLSLWWLTAATLILTIGELYLSPIGLSLVTKVSPPRMVSMMMGVWFLSSFLGNYLSGWIGGYYEVFTKETFFSILMVMAAAAGLVFIAVKKPLSRVMGEGSYPNHPIRTEDSTIDPGLSEAGRKTLRTLQPDAARGQSNLDVDHPQKGKEHSLQDPNL